MGGSAGGWEFSKIRPIHYTGECARFKSIEPFSLHVFEEELNIGVEWSTCGPFIAQQAVHLIIKHLIEATFDRTYSSLVPIGHVFFRFRVAKKLCFKADDMPESSVGFTQPSGRIESLVVFNIC